MSPLSKSIIYTLAFYDAVGRVPLTSIELYKNLFPTEGLYRMSFGGFLKALDLEKKILRRHIKYTRGFYSLKKNANGYKKRVEIGKTSIKKWRIARRMSRLISFLPYVRMVAITGSLALNSTNKNSDIDMLIVAKAGHIWTTRVIVSALMHVLGKRRHAKFIRDRICLNHYVSDSESILRPRQLFSDHISSTFIPIWKSESYLVPFSKKNTVYLQTISETHPMLMLRHFIEWGFSKGLSPKLEKALKVIQMRKIEGRQFIADDNALVFHHPRPQNQEALYLYKQNLRQLNLS